MYVPFRKFGHFMFLPCCETPIMKHIPFLSSRSVPNFILKISRVVRNRQVSWKSYECKQISCVSSSAVFAQDNSVTSQFEGIGSIVPRIARVVSFRSNTGKFATENYSVQLREILDGAYFRFRESVLEIIEQLRDCVARDLQIAARSFATSKPRARQEHFP